VNKIYPDTNSEIARKVKLDAKELVEKYYRRKPRSGRAPTSIGCGAVYAVIRLHGYDVTQENVAKAGGRREYTVRHAYRDILRTLE